MEKYMPTLETRLFGRGVALTFVMRLSHPPSAMALLPFSFVVIPENCILEHSLKTHGGHCLIFKASDMQWIASKKLPRYALTARGRATDVDPSLELITLIHGNFLSCRPVLLQKR